MVKKLKFLILMQILKMINKIKIIIENQKQMNDLEKQNNKLSRLKNEL